MKWAPNFDGGFHLLDTFLMLVIVSVLATAAVNIGYDAGLFGGPSIRLERWRYVVCRLVLAGKDFGQEHHLV